MIANKTDAGPAAAENLATLRSKTDLPVLAVSAMRGEGITEVTAWLRSTVERMRAAAVHPVDAATGIRTR